MAEPIALQVKPPQVMTLGDMVNIARGAQAYQQAEQLNPLLAQKAQMEIEQAQKANPLALTKAMMEIEQARKMNPLAVSKSTEEVRQAEIGTNKQQLELDQSHFNLAGNILSGLETRAQMLAKKGDSATALKELKAAESWMNASGLKSQEGGPTRQAEEQLKKGDFTGYLATLENMRNVLGGAASRFQSNLPQVATVAGAPATFTQSSGIAKPLEIGGPQPTVTPPPSQPNVVPPQGGVQPSNAPQGVTPIQMSLPYPVRKAGDIRPLAPSEEADRENGQKYRESLAQSTTNLSKSIRNIDEVIKDAEKIASKEWNRGAGIAGTVGRNVSTFLGTDMGIEYARLSKSLAQLQLALGADTTTDRGRDLMAAANGSITLPPDVLQEIAHRTRAEKQNIEMQSQGAQVFSQKYGDANLKKFQKDWADNSKDSRVLEAISIYNSDMSAEDKQTQINRLFENASPKYLEDVKRYRRNLEKLSKTGGL